MAHSTNFIRPFRLNPNATEFQPYAPPNAISNQQNQNANTIPIPYIHYQNPSDIYYSELDINLPSNITNNKYIWPQIPQQHLNKLYLVIAGYCHLYHFIVPNGINRVIMLYHGEDINTELIGYNKRNDLIKYGFSVTDYDTKTIVYYMPRSIKTIPSLYDPQCVGRNIAVHPNIIAVYNQRHGNTPKLHDYDRFNAVFSYQRYQIFGKKIDFNCLLFTKTNSFHLKIPIPQIQQIQDPETLQCCYSSKYGLFVLTDDEDGRHTQLSSFSLSQWKWNTKRMQPIGTVGATHMLPVDGENALFIVRNKRNSCCFFDLNHCEFKSIKWPKGLGGLSAFPTICCDDNRYRRIYVHKRDGDVYWNEGIEFMYYDIEKMQWKELPSMNERILHGDIWLNDDRNVLYALYKTEAYSKRLKMLDLRTSVWSHCIPFQNENLTFAKI